MSHDLAFGAFHDIEYNALPPTGAEIDRVAGLLQAWLAAYDINPDSFVAIQLQRRDEPPVFRWFLSGELPDKCRWLLSQNRLGHEVSAGAVAVQKGEMADHYLRLPGFRIEPPGPRPEFARYADWPMVGAAEGGAK